MKLSENQIVIVETKGLEDLDVPLKMARLKQWCEDVNAQEGRRASFGFVFVDQESFDKYNPKKFFDLMNSFLEYQ